MKLSAVAGGNLQGPEILFIHGFSQAHVSWMNQLSAADLLERFHMVAFDLRGHGMSAKPLDRSSYEAEELWADDLKAVIAAAGLSRPVLVAWSFAGRIVTDYMRHHGTSGIAGINLVGGLAKSSPEHEGPGTKHIGGMLSEELLTNIAATRRFVRDCFAAMPEPELYEQVLAFNMMVPPQVRRAMVTRKPNPGDFLPRIDVPVLVTHGAEDLVIRKGLGEYAASVIPRARLSLYDGIGHSPFVEDTPRFNRELADFVNAISN
jgi:pimeloyl-ACP methyl ester carboxylesterase